MAPGNGLDSVNYVMGNGGQISHNSINRNFTYGAAVSVGEDLKVRNDPIKYFRYDGFANQTWDVYNHAFCNIYHKDITTSLVRHPVT